MKLHRYSLSDLTIQRRSCGEQLLQLYKKANAGHIGSSLSCLDILIELCFDRMEQEDYVILSKGHAAAALYTVLKACGRLPETELESFYRDGTLLAAHPPCSRRISAIPFGTGSLGHGLGLACGLAFSQRFTDRKFNLYVVLSDGDCNEGSTWEAALFAGHHALSNLCVVVDLNGIQGIGRSRDILDLEPIVDKWKAFGFSVAVAENGNDFESLRAAHEALRASNGPRCVIARTVKGHGISFMQDKVEWHYLPMTESHFAQAIEETRQGRSVAS